MWKIMSNFRSNYIDKIKSHLDDGELMLAILDEPQLMYEDALREKIKDLSMRLKGWVESNKKSGKRPLSRELKILLIYHYCPYLIRSPDFSWLFHEVCSMVKETHFNSEAFDRYWRTLGLLKTNFRTTNSFEPELPWKILSETIKEEGNLWREKEINFLKKLYDAGKKSDEKYYIKLSQQSKIKREMIIEEVERFSDSIQIYAVGRGIKPAEAIEKCSKEIFWEVYNDKASDKKFWNWVEREISEKQEKKIKSLAIQKVAERNNITSRSVRRHLNHMNRLWQRN